jgi:DNA replication protein DnaC
LKNGREILEVIEGRSQLVSTIIISQLPVGHWHEVLGDPTLADAILDRIIYNAHKICLRGESMRKVKGGVSTPASK